ncbi:hypothetical protein L7F22_066336 [Adiantum nelumboides]|nr:hypothetical protein [Adiantum nelumboides]
MSSRKVDKEPPKKRRQVKKQLHLPTATATSNVEGETMSSPQTDESKEDDLQEHVAHRGGGTPSSIHRSNSNLGDNDCEDETLGPVEIMKEGDILSHCRLLDVSKCLQSLFVDCGALKDALEGETYCPEKGTFIVSIVSSTEESIPVTTAMQQAWDPHWQTIDKEFEGEFKGKKSLSFVSNKMFYVWEKNHHTIAWMELIAEKYRKNKAWHFRVVNTVIDPSKRNEVVGWPFAYEQHAVIKTNLKDVLVNVAKICDCDFEISLNEETSQVAKTLEAKRKIEAKSSLHGALLQGKILLNLYIKLKFQEEMRIKIYEANQERRPETILAKQEQSSIVPPVTQQDQPCYKCGGNHWAKSCSRIQIIGYCLDCGITHVVPNYPEYPKKQGKTTMNVVGVLPSSKGSEAEPKIPMKVVTRAQAKENAKDQVDEEKDQQPKQGEIASVSVKTGRKSWKAKRKKAKAKHEQKQSTLVAELSQVQEELKLHREKKASIMEPNKAPRAISSGGSMMVDKVLEPLDAALEAYEARLKPKHPNGTTGEISSS